MPSISPFFITSIQDLAQLMTFDTDAQDSSYLMTIIGFVDIFVAMVIISSQEPKSVFQELNDKTLSVIGTKSKMRANGKKRKE